jgi:plasmid stabilization system protein ParE
LKLRFTPLATENIALIADYIRERNPAAALRVRASIYESLQLLILFPFLGRQQKERGVRKFVTPRFGYLVYYTINEAEEEIVILSVKHSAQRPEHDDM